MSCEVLCVDLTDGYGEDRQTHLEPFPFTQPSPKQKDEDAELRRQLNNMGGGECRSYCN
jgi:hypothetical protein